MEKTDEQKEADKAEEEAKKATEKATEKAEKATDKVKKAEEKAKKESEEPIEVEKSKEPQFKNNGKDVKIKLIDDEDSDNFKWITVKKGQVVTIPRKIALANKLVKVK